MNTVTYTLNKVHKNGLASYKADKSRGSGTIYMDSRLFADSKVPATIDVTAEGLLTPAPKPAPAPAAEPAAAPAEAAPATEAPAAPAAEATKGKPRK